MVSGPFSTLSRATIGLLVEYHCHKVSKQQNSPFADPGTVCDQFYFLDSTISPKDLPHIIFIHLKVKINFRFKKNIRF